MKALCFNNLEDVEKRFDKISKAAQFKEDHFQEFLKYFQQTLIKGRPFYPRLYLEGNIILKWSTSKFIKLDCDFVDYIIFYIRVGDEGKDFP